jgi:hypothetical protein
MGVRNPAGAITRRGFLEGEKTASGITHGSSYPILNRNEKLEWVIGFQKHQRDAYVKQAPVFGYLMLGHFYTEVFRLFQIADTTNLNGMADVCMRLANQWRILQRSVRPVTVEIPR